MEHQSTLFPAAGTAEGLSTVPISTLPPEAGISFELWKKIEEQAKKRAYNLAYYAANREKILKQAAGYLSANAEKIRLSRKARYDENLERERARSRAHRSANLEKSRAREAAYAKANPDKRRASNAAWRAANSERLAKFYADRQRSRHKTDPVFRLTHSLRSRLILAFKAQGANKATTTFELIGCTKEELRQHLVSQFREGMTLENHGKVWHIDHIRPCASFDLSDPNQATLCFHYSNLQPLFVDENLRKGGQWKPTEIRPLAA